VSLRLWWKLNWFPAVFLTALGVVVGAGGIWYAWNLRCDNSLTTAQCSQYLINSGPSWIVSWCLVLIPMMLGIMFGASAVAAEQERGTSTFAWSIVPDRRKHLAAQILISLIVVTSLGLLCGGLSTLIVAKLNPGHNLPASFAGYGMWGPVLAVRAVAAFGASLVLGLLLKRVVASVAVGFVASVAVLFLAMTIGRSFEPAQIIPRGDPAAHDALGVTSGIVGPRGSYISLDECVQAEPAGLTDQQQLAWQEAKCSEVSLYLRGSQMPSVELRESLFLGMVAVAGVGLTLLLIPSRRASV
jgi:hypothetical protein